MYAWYVILLISYNEPTIIIIPTYIGTYLLLNIMHKETNVNGRAVIRKMRGFHFCNLCKQSFWWEKGLIISYLDNWAVFAQGLGLLAQLLCSRLTKSILISKLVCTYVVSFCTLSYQNFFCAYSFSDLHYNLYRTTYVRSSFII